MGSPGGLVWSQITLERVLTPWTLCGQTDRCKGRDRFELLWMAQGQGQGAVATHGMAKDAYLVDVDRQMLCNQWQQFGSEVTLHAVVLAPRRLCGIQIKAGAHTKVPTVRVTWQVGSPRAGIGRNQCQPQFGGMPLRSGFGHEGFFIAGQAGQIHQRGYRAVCCLRRQVHREAHGQPDLARVVLDEKLFAAEATVFRQGFEGHVLDCTSSHTASANTSGISCGRLCPAPGTSRCERGPLNCWA